MSSAAAVYESILFLSCCHRRSPSFSWGKTGSCAFRIRKEGLSFTLCEARRGWVEDDARAAQRDIIALKALWA